MKLETILAQVAKPENLVIYSHRGYGKSTVARHLPQTAPWSKLRSGYLVVDVGEHDDPQEALSYVSMMDKRLRERTPDIHARIFLRAEHWYTLRKQKQFHHLKPYAWEMPAMTIPDALFGAGMPRHKDASGTVVLAAVRQEMDEDPDVTPLWVWDQPECEWLCAMLPPSDSQSNKVAVARAREKLRNYRERCPEVLCGDMEVPAFLAHAETILAIKRVGEGSYQWSPLWLHGCREWLKIHGA